MRGVGSLEGTFKCRGCAGRVWWLMMLDAVVVEELFFFLMKFGFSL